MPVKGQEVVIGHIDDDARGSASRRGEASACSSRDDMRVSIGIYRAMQFDALSNVAVKPLAQWSLNKVTQHGPNPARIRVRREQQVCEIVHSTGVDLRFGSQKERASISICLMMSISSVDAKKRFVEVAAC